MSGSNCPRCGEILSNGEEVCPKCGDLTEDDTPVEPEDAVVKAGNGEEMPGSKEGEEDRSGEYGEDEEENMLKNLMEKVMSAQAELDDDLGGGLDELKRRVGGVVDTIDRLENYQDAHQKGEKEDKEKETSPQEEQQGTEEKPLEPEEDDAPPVEEGDAIDGDQNGHLSKEPPFGPSDGLTVEDAIPMGHFDFPTESPYESMRASLEAMEDEFEPETDTAYQVADLDPITDNLIALIRMRRNEGDLQEAMELLEMASELSPNDNRISEEMKVLEAILGSQVDASIISEEGGSKTTVLAEELTDTISRLEASASSAIAQLERLIETTDQEKEDVLQVKERLKDALVSFKEKRFHNAEKLAKEGIERIKEIIQEAMDASTQENIDIARDLMDELEESKIQKDRMLYESLKDTFEEGVKAFLSEEFERSNLLSREVIRKILDHRDPEAGQIKEIVIGYRRKLSSYKDLTFLEEEIKDIISVLNISEEMVRKRKYSDAKKLLERIDGKVKELEEKKEMFTKAKEMRIKITNRYDRLQGGDDSIKAQDKKVKYLNMLFERERFEDLLSIGREIEGAFDKVEEQKQKIDASSLMNGLTDIARKAEELDGGLEYLSRFDRVKSNYEKGDHGAMIQEGRPLLNEMKMRLKKQFLERAAKVSALTTESKLLIFKLQSFGTDPKKEKEELKRATNLIKGGGYVDGIKVMEDLITRMREETSRRGEYLKDFLAIHHDSLEAIMDRYRDDPNMFLIRKKRVPIINKLTELGKYKRALDLYEDLGSSFPRALTKGDIKKRIQNDLNELKFEIYTKKDEGLDITEPLSYYNKAKKRFSDGSLIEAEYLTILSRKYIDDLLGPNKKKASA